MLVFNVEALSVIRLLFTYHNSAPLIPLNNSRNISLEWHSCFFYTPSCRMNSIKRKFQFWRRLHRLNLLLRNHRNLDPVGFSVNGKWFTAAALWDQSSPLKTFIEKICKSGAPNFQHYSKGKTALSYNRPIRAAQVGLQMGGVGHNVCITRVEVDATCKISIIFLLKWLVVKAFWGIVKFPDGKAAVIARSCWTMWVDIDAWRGPYLSPEVWRCDGSAGAILFRFKKAG